MAIAHGDGNDTASPPHPWGLGVGGRGPRCAPQGGGGFGGGGAEADGET